MTIIATLTENAKRHRKLLLLLALLGLHVLGTEGADVGGAEADE